jgi:hypothetical protein
MANPQFELNFEMFKNVSLLLYILQIKENL